MDKKLEAIPRPTCCEAAQKYPVVYFYVDVYESGDSSKVEGTWRVVVHDAFVQEYGSIEWFKTRPAPKFCPYCGTPLPKMVRVQTRKNICKVTDGGYYCDTCKERLRSCKCYPPEAAFKPEVI